MKKSSLAALVLVVASALGAGGYFGKQYFDENYVLLNQEEIMEINMAVQAYAQSAFAAGKDSCRKML